MLEHDLAQVHARAEHHAKSKSTLADFWAAPWREREAEIRHELQLAKAERDRELFEVRLHSGPIGHGTMPLRMLARFIEPFVSAIEHAAYRLHRGKDARAAIPSALLNAMDVQLAGLQAGSARLMLTGKLSPDLGGASVLENTLVQMFRLLDGEDDFSDAVDAVGVPAARKLAEAFKPLEDAGSGMDMNWTAPNGTRHAWASDTTILGSFRRKVASLGEPEIFERTLVGQVRALRDTGIIELRDQLGKSHRIRYGLAQQQEVASLNLWMNIIAKVRTERVHDPIAGRNIDRNHLIEIVAPASGRSSP